jgi:hypothetical protein
MECGPLLKVLRNCVSCILLLLLDNVSAEAKLMTEYILAGSHKGHDGSPSLRMMFAARADGANANILFDSGALHNYVSTTFATLTGKSELVLLC